MSGLNKIVKKLPVGTIIKDGKSILLSVATETSDWKRTDAAALRVAPAFKTSVVKHTGPLPKDTQEICVR